MPKFKIEMELTSINERILLADFDSSIKNSTITFNEQLTEDENDQYTLTFSLPEEVEGINLKSLINVGRPLWLHLFAPVRSIRMAITSYSYAPGTDNKIYEITAQDYASYVFAKNNAGLTLDTFEDEDFLDWKKLRIELDYNPIIKDNQLIENGFFESENLENFVFDNYLGTPVVDLEKNRLIMDDPPTWTFSNVETYLNLPVGNYFIIFDISEDMMVNPGPGILEYEAGLSVTNTQTWNTVFSASSGLNEISTTGEFLNFSKEDLLFVGEFEITEELEYRILLFMYHANFPSFIYNNLILINQDVFEEPITVEEFRQLYLDKKALNKLVQVKDIANHILQRGWLQKEDPIGNISGWTVIGKSEILERPVNISLSNSNTYNGLVEIANSINLNLRFNYNEKTVEFYNRDDDDLDKNYTLSEGFNLENYTKTYEGSNLYTLFYVQGGENELGEFITLFDEVEYRDNFLLNLDYFKDTGILSISDYSEIMANFEDGGTLQTINTRLSELIKDKFNQVASINVLWNIIRNSSEIMYGDVSNTEIYMTEYQKFFRAFEFFEWDPDKVTRKRALTKSFAAQWSSLDLAFNVQPENWINVVYNGETFDTNNFQYTLSFEPGPGLREYYFQTPGGGRIVYYADEVGFTEELLTDVEGTVRYFKNIVIDENEKEFPFVRALYRLDGENSLDEKETEIQGQIDFLKDGWVWDYRVKRCLEAVPTEQNPEDLINMEDPNVVELCDFLIDDNLMPRTWAAVEERLASINKRFNDRIYEKQLGEASFAHLSGSEVEINIDETTLGRWTHIKKYFDKTRNEFSSDETPIMENYRKQWQEKLNFWYNLKEDRQHIFLEGYFEDDVEDNAQDLKTKAEIIYQNHKTPNEDFGVSYIDPSEILGLEVNSLQVGDFVKFKDSNLNEESRLKVASISRILKQNSNITVTIYRYNMVNQLLEQMIARINERRGV